MLYDNPACSNSYYWHNLVNISYLLILLSFFISIIYSIFLLIKNREKKDVKPNTLNMISCFGAYLIGACLLINKNIDPVYGIILVFISAILLAYMRQNMQYLLLSFVIGLFLDNAFAIVTVRLCLFLLYILAVYSIRKLPKKKKTLYIIPLVILLVMFLSGIAVGTYVATNRPEAYCWSAK